MIDIVNANCSPNTSGNLIAANICANLTLGGYSDWFLPSKDELNLIWLNLVDPDGDTFNSGFGDTNNLGGFVSNLYWSSTEYDSNSAWIHFLGHGDQVTFNKNSTNHVRAIRAF